METWILRRFATLHYMAEIVEIILSFPIFRCQSRIIKRLTASTFVVMCGPISWVRLITKFRARMMQATLFGITPFHLIPKLVIPTQVIQISGQHIREIGRFSFFQDSKHNSSHHLFFLEEKQNRIGSVEMKAIGKTHKCLSTTSPRNLTNPHSVSESHAVQPSVPHVISQNVNSM